MSTISNATAGNPGAVRPNPYHSQKTVKYDRKAGVGDAQDADTAEISEEAKALAQSAEETGSLLQATKKMKMGSEAYDKFRELMERVKSRKTDVTARMESALEKNGIDLSQLGKAKIEVDASGRIAVGGLSDLKATRALEKALNQEAGLASAIKEFQNDEAALSREIKEYTGCTLYELTMTARGDVGERIRSELENDGQYQFDADYYLRLGFLGTDTSFVGLEDVSALSFNGNFDFSGEISVIADPEGSIKQSLKEMHQAIQSAFDAVNAEALEGLEAKGLAGDDAAGRLLTLADATISIDSFGGVEISGMLSKDPATHQKGMEMANKILVAMMTGTEGNSYHVNVFAAASRNLINRDAEYPGQADDTKVTARMKNGAVEDIRVAPEQRWGRMSAQARGLVGKIQSSINKTMAHVVRQ